VSSVRDTKIGDGPKDPVSGKKPAGNPSVRAVITRPTVRTRLSHKKKGTP